MKDNPLTLSQRFEDALAYATVVHAGQLRKGTGIPYIAHILGVTAIALEHGADEDEAMAALLHDAGEDVGGLGESLISVLGSATKSQTS
jgi:(p)ppGpp synthase/HD superfamily hydrolase